MKRSIFQVFSLMVLADETYRSFARRDFQSIGLKIRGPAQRPDLETLRVSNLPLRMTRFQFVVILSEAKDLYIMIMDDVIPIPQLRDEPCYTKFLLKHVQMWSGFFVLAKLSGGRRCSASLTEAKHSQGGKDARRCAWIRWNLVSAQSPISREEPLFIRVSSRSPSPSVPPGR